MPFLQSELTRQASAPLASRMLFALSAPHQVHSVSHSGDRAVTRPERDLTVMPWPDSRDHLRRRVCADGATLRLGGVWRREELCSQGWHHAVVDQSFATVPEWPAVLNRLALLLRAYLRLRFSLTRRLHR